MSDPGILWDDHERQLELERAHAVAIAQAQQPSVKAVKIQAKRDVKVARANSEEYAYMRMVKYVAAAVTVIIVSMIGGCTLNAVTDTPVPKTDAQIKAETEQWKDCIDKGGEPTHYNGNVDCDDLDGE